MQVIVVAIVFAILGIFLGLLSPVTIPITYARYTDLSIAAIVAFGVRIFNNLGAIRRHYL